MIRILAIFGETNNLDLTRQKKTLENLGGVKVEPLENPTVEEIDTYLSNEKGWSVVFFAGHSETERFPSGITGAMQINETDIIGIEALEAALQDAVEKGLKLAIFNSCDGIGLAMKALEYGVPYCIIFKERVSNRVAAKFVQDFFTNFQKLSISLALRRARKRLVIFKQEYPYAQWLPQLHQHTDAPELTWEMLGGRRSIINSITIGFNRWKDIFIQWFKQQKFLKKYWFPFLLGLITIFCLAVILPNIKNIEEIRGAVFPPQRKDACTLELASKQNDKNILKDISCGEKSLGIFEKQFPSTQEKKEGITAFHDKKYSVAVNKFTTFLEKNRLDFETAIYLENAQVLANKKDGTKIFPVAVLIPTRGSKPEIIYVTKSTLQGVYNQQKKFNDDNSDKKLLIVIVNDNNDAGDTKNNIEGQAQKIAKELAQRNIYAVIGSYSSRVGFYTKDIYQNAKIPMLSYSNSATTTQYLDENKNKVTLSLTDNEPFLFRICSNNRQLIPAIVKYIKRKNFQNIMSFFNSEDISSGSFGQELELEKKNKLLNVNIDNRYLGELEQKQVNSILPTTNEDNTVIVMCPGAFTNQYDPNKPTGKDIENANYILKNYNKNFTIIGCNILVNYTSALNEIQDRKNLKNILVTTPWFYEPNNENPQFAEWKKVWEEQKVNYYTNPFVRTVLAQDATMVVAEALLKLDEQGKQASGKELQKYLSNSDNKFQGITGKISFTGSDRSNNTSQLITPKIDLNSKEWNGDWEIVK